MTTRSAVFAALNNQKDGPKFDIPSRIFVKQWIEHPEQLKVLEETYKKNADTLPRLRELMRQGKLTEEIRQRVDELLVRGSMPKTTPAGLEIGREAKMEYVQQARVEAVPSLAIEGCDFGA